MRPAWRALEQRERLLADAAHELRTPVAVMRGSVELAERGSGGAAAGADRALPFTGRRYGHRALPGAPGGPRPPGRPDRPRPARWRCGVRAAARAPARSPRRAGAGRADRPAGRRVTLTIRP
nr:histidine kinase dimerization/phospho-acceptor domain-containing protein [Streptomyces sp. B27]